MRDERSDTKRKEEDGGGAVAVSPRGPRGGGGGEGGYSLFGGRYQLRNYSPHILAMDSSWISNI